MAHACNSGFSGGRDQEDHSSKLAWANSSWGPISKNSSPNRAGRVAQGVGPDFKPQDYKKKKLHKYNVLPIELGKYIM
jgi:hypothetical protein